MSNDNKPALPQQGGSHVVQPDGSLKRVEFTAHPDAPAEASAAPAPAPEPDKAPRRGGKETS
jgi:hypothetical protein